MGYVNSREFMTGERTAVDNLWPLLRIPGWRGGMLPGRLGQ